MYHSIAWHQLFHIIMTIYLYIYIYIYINLCIYIYYRSVINASTFKYILINIHKKELTLNSCRSKNRYDLKYTILILF
jgi:hypothetical protein